MLPIFIKSLGLDHAEAYNKIRDGEGEYVYPRYISWIHNLYNILFSAGLLYFFYSIAFHKKSYVYIIAFIIALFLPNFFHSIIVSSRGVMFFSFFNFVIAFVIFKKFLSRKLTMVMTSFFVVFIVILSIYSIAITVDRFGGKTSKTTPIDAIFSYFGEPYLNFSQIFWEEIDQNLNGERLFPQYTNALGLSDVRLDLSSGERNSYYSLKTKAPVHLFKTLPGDFYIDFGLWGGFVCAIIFSLFGLFYIRRKSNRMTFHTLLIFFFYYQICIYGIFSFPKAGIRGFYEFVGIILLYYFFRIDFKKSKIKSV